MREKKFGLWIVAERDGREVVKRKIESEIDENESEVVCMRMKRKHMKKRRKQQN